MPIAWDDVSPGAQNDYNGPGTPGGTTDGTLVDSDGDGIPDIVDATPNGGNGSTGSDGGGGGGGVDLSGYIAQLEELFNSWGIPVDQQVQAFIHRAAVAGWNQAQMLQALRQTKFYAQAFPGIMRRDGTLRMTEAQYLAFKTQVQDLAAAEGMNLSDKAIGLMVKGELSVNEARDRLEAIHSMRTNKDMLAEFNQFLKAKGLINKPLDRKGLLKFVMGEGPKEFEKAWDNAYAATQLQYLGIKVGKPKKGNDISYKKLNFFIEKWEANNPGADISSQGANFFQQSGLAADWDEIAEYASVYGVKLGPTARLQLMFGGKKADDVMKRLKFVQAQHEAFINEQRATPTLQQSATGTTLGGYGGRGEGALSE